MSRNEEVAALLEEFADLLEAQDVDYKPRAYRDAAESVRGHHQAIEDLAAEGQDAVAELDNVGDAISAKIVEYVETGEIEELEELRSELPVDIRELTSVEGVGPKTVGSLYEALGIETLDDLEAAAEAGEIQAVDGFGAKTEQNILDNVEFAREAHERQLLGEALPRGEDVREYLRDVPAVEAAKLAGSIRRWEPTIGDVDVLVSSEEGEAVVEAFTDWPQADVVIEAGTNKASVRSKDVRVDLRVVVPEEFGSALQYFTGNVDHNVALRNMAIERDLKMNEYGMFDVSEVRSTSENRAESGGEVENPDAGQRVGERVAGDTEESMYEALDLPWIEPELRQNRGEIEAAREGELPDLIEEGAIRGDLHVHTDCSDGAATLEEMVEGAEAFGHDYVAIADHATGPGMVGGVGLSDDELLDQIAAIREVDEQSDVDVLAGVEANVDAEGGVSVGDDVLEQLDCVVASPHSGLDGDGTDRLVAAAEHPEVDIIGHPTGRLLNQRPGLDLDVERLAEAAAEHDTALEINSDPRRLDLEGRMVHLAIDAGATVAVDTDAHRPASYHLVRYGLHTARRGWAEEADVLNTRDLDGLRDFLG